MCIKLRVKKGKEIVTAMASAGGVSFINSSNGSRAEGPLTLPLVDVTIERNFVMVMASCRSRRCFVIIVGS